MNGKQRVRCDCNYELGGDFNDDNDFDDHYHDDDDGDSDDDGWPVLFLSLYIEVVNLQLESFPVYHYCTTTNCNNKTVERTKEKTKENKGQKRNTLCAKGLIL